MGGCQAKPKTGRPTLLDEKRHKSNSLEAKIVLIGS